MKEKLLSRTFSLVGILVLLLSVVGMPTTRSKAASTITFTAGELLGKPEDTSITVNIVPASTIEYHYQYGTTSGSYTGQTGNATATGGQPSEVVISGLTANTQVYYRMQYHAPGDAMTDWVNRDEHSFWTQRARGSSFTFTVTSDSHAQWNTAHQQAMTNIANEHPDFNIDLGDTFSLDGTTSQSAVNSKYLAYRAPLYMGKIGPSVPIFLASGNHEDEEGWNLDDTPFSIAQGSIQGRKLYFPTPINDGFYSANTDILPAINAATYGDQLREDYYAWTWGDALFVVIDEYQYTMNLPYAPVAGEGTDDTKTGDQWSWTLGKQQYQWFKQTLENSHAKYKFVFSHNMLGGVPRDLNGVGAGYVRGGAEAAAYFEWGGENADRSAGFAAHRSAADFGTVPIHQLMVANGVSAYFHGHDHQYVYETRDGIVYQLVPPPSTGVNPFSGVYTAGDHGTYNTIKILPPTGHLLITINPTQAKVDYISSGSSTPTVNYSYTIAPHASGITHDLTMAVNDPAGGKVSPAAGDHTYNEGDVVPITATPNPGYFFSGWSGDVGTLADASAASTSITMNGDYSISATFSNLLTITPTPSNTPTATSTPTDTPTATPSSTPTNTRSPTATFTPSNTRTSTPTPSTTRTATSTRTSTTTTTPTYTRTPTATFTPSSTPTEPPPVTFTPSSTPTFTPTPTATRTNTVTSTPSRTPTRTNSPTASKTPTRTNTPSITPTRTSTPTRTNTPLPGSNLLSNGDMESGTAGWSVFGSGTLSSDTSVFHGGLSSLKITGRTAAWNGPSQVVTGLTSGQAYTVKVWVRSQTGTPTARATLKLTAGSTTYVNLAAAAVTSTGWTQLSGTVTVSWSGTLTNARFYVETAAGTDTLNIDDAQLYH